MSLAHQQLPDYSTEELRRRGWTPALISRFLGRHDFASRGTRRYYGERVEQAEELADFQVAQALEAKLAARIEELADVIAAVRIDVERLSMNELRARAIEEWRERSTEPDGPIPAHVVKRAAVNYARFKLCTYEPESLAPLVAAIGRWNAMRALRPRTFAAIGAAYPSLEAEAKRQAQEMWM